MLALIIHFFSYGMWFNENWRSINKSRIINYQCIIYQSRSWISSILLLQWALLSLLGKREMVKKKIEIIEIELCIHISINYTTIQIFLDRNNKNGLRYRRKLINVAVITWRLRFIVLLHGLCTNFKIDVNDGRSNPMFHFWFLIFELHGLSNCNLSMFTEIFQRYELVTTSSWRV